ncbi:MAG: DNA mismatch repair protein MutS [Pseudomonadota bacterium]
MAQFLTLKAAYPEYLLFFRMGDFYELFFEDAGLAAEALGIALTKRGRIGDEEIPMCGVPIHNAERYLHELIRKNFRVAVAEQLEDPAEAKKRGSKAVVKRDVVRLVTPGTLTEDALLEHRRNNYLCAVAARRDRIGVAWADISTGALATTSLAPAGFAALMARLAPAEVILPAPEDDILAAAAREAGAAVAELAPSSFTPKRGAARAAALFEAAGLDAFGAFAPEEEGALGALVDYLELTQRGALPTLRPPRREIAGERLVIDAATRRNLELTRGPEGGRAGSLLAAIDRTVTSGGARLLEAWLAAPLMDVPLIRARHDAVGWLLSETSVRDALRALLRRTPDLERALSRLGLGRGGPKDLAALRDGLTAAGEAADLLSAGAPPTLVIEAAQDLAGLGALAAELARAITETPPFRLSDGGAIREEYDPDLDEARTLRDGAMQVIMPLQADYQAQTDIAALKIKHNNVLGYFIETPATHARRMMSAPLSETFQHRQTTANAVRFTSAALAELEAKITRSAVRARELEAALFERLSAAVLEEGLAIARLAEAMAMLDIWSGLALLAEEERWVRPAVDESRAFRIEGGRHPVVEQALRREGGEGFVPNDCDLTAEARGDGDPAQPIWLVTGPNMAGKSTYLRQNALIAALAQMGAFAPASAAHIGVVDQLFSRVGAADDLARGRSTFMVEMVETAAILNQSGPRSLVILDEIGRGTATYDGLAIAWATLEHLAEANRCRGLFATHYHELTALAAATPGLKNVTVAVREWKGSVVFLREIRPGAADRSYGVQVAKLAGMPKAVTARAKALLETLERGSEGPAARAARLVEDLPLFAAAPAPEAAPNETPEETHADLAAGRLRAALEATEPDAMTPRQALDALYALKALLADSDDA